MWEKLQIGNSQVDRCFEHPPAKSSVNWTSSSTEKRGIAPMIAPCGKSRPSVFKQYWSIYPGNTPCSGILLMNTNARRSRKVKSWNVESQEPHEVNVSPRFQKRKVNSTNEVHTSGWIIHCKLVVKSKKVLRSASQPCGLWIRASVVQEKQDGSWDQSQGGKRVRKDCKTSLSKGIWMDLIYIYNSRVCTTLDVFSSC